MYTHDLFLSLVTSMYYYIFNTFSSFLKIGTHFFGALCIFLGDYVGVYYCIMS